MHNLPGVVGFLRMHATQSWSGILIQYHGKVKEYGTKVNITHLIAEQTAHSKVLKRIGVHSKNEPMSFIFLFAKCYFFSKRFPC